MKQTLATGLCPVNSRMHIHTPVAVGYRNDMPTTEENRRHNLEALIQEQGSIVAVAEKADTAPAYLSQIIHRVQQSTDRKPRDSTASRPGRTASGAQAIRYGD